MKRSGLDRIEQKIKELEKRVLATPPTVIRVIDAEKRPDPERSVFALAYDERDDDVMSELLDRIEGPYPSQPNQPIVQLVITGPSERAPEPEPEPATPEPEPVSPYPRIVPVLPSGYTQTPPSVRIDPDRLRRFGLS